MDTRRDLGLLIQSRHPLIFAHETDEERFLKVVREAAAAPELSLPVWTWSIARGLCRDGEGSQYQTTDAKKALEFIAAAGLPGVFVFLDAHSLLQDAIVVRRLKELAQSAMPGITLLVAVQHSEIPPELDGIALPWKLEPASDEELMSLLQRTVNDLSRRGIPVSLTPSDMDQLVSAIKGLSMREGMQAITEAAMADGALDGEDVAMVRGAKAAFVGSDGILELVESEHGQLDQVGGMQGLKDWLTVRGQAFSEGAQEFGLEPPRGVLLTGVPGCGKSLVAKTLATTWEMPLILLDPARLYGSYVGQSEQRLQDALTTIEAMVPCVVWVDEIEKGFSASEQSDGGVSMRIRGTFLRWLQDRPPGVFVVATCNEVKTLPAEFFRKGRFDEVFFVDLPGPAEREQIFALHLAKRKRDVASFDLAALAAASDGFSGSEIEAAIVAGLYRAFAAKADVTTATILEELGATSPLSQTRAEDVAALRAWAKERAVPADGVRS